VGADGVRLLVLGTIKAAGSGCFCPENSLLRSLLEHIVLESDEAVVVDMEAGLEQFGRATCRGVDLMIVVVEPGSRSVETAARVVQLAKDMGVSRTAVVANRVRSAAERDAVTSLLKGFGLELAESMPASDAVSRADLEGKSVFDVQGSEEWVSSVRRLSQKISKILEQPRA
jgi:CO dehydrogenase maturation factor